MSKATNELLKRVIKHAENYGFLNIIENNGIYEHFKFGPAGQLLRENIRKEWLYSNVTHRESNVFTFKSVSSDSDFTSDIKEAFKFAKHVLNSECPFHLVDSGKHVVSPDIEEKDVIHPRNHEVFKCYAIMPPNEAEQFFYRFQQQRKRWWRKLSLDPGKYELEELEKNEDGVRAKAKIGAHFPWGFHCLETVEYHGGVPFQDVPFEDINIFSIRANKKRCLPHVIECNVSLDFATFSYLCDAFSTKSTKSKIILKFHRKMAPFKFSFACDNASAEENKTLHELAELLCLQLRKSGLHCLLPSKSDFAKKLEMQLLRSDSLGIPYTAVLSKDTLGDGFFGLYSRDTTLQEQVHVGKMAEYGELLMKNF